MKGFATTDGQMFEVKTSALLYLKGLNSGRPFQLATNVEGAGAFDDIIFRSLALGKTGGFWNTYLFQLKHKLRADLTSQALTASKGDFALVKYYDSYLKTRQTMVKSDKGEIFDGEFKDCHFIILTNACVSKELKRHDITDASPDVDEVVRFDGDEFIFNVSSCQSFVSCLEGKDLGKDFLNKLQIFSRAPRVNEMDDLISDEILKTHKFTASQAKRLTEIFVDEFQGWCVRSNVILDETSDILNRAVSKLKIEVLQPTLYERLTLDLTFKKSSVQTFETALSERCSVLHIISAEHSIEVSCSKLLQVLKETKDSTILTSLECFFQEKDAFLYVWESLLVIAVDTAVITPGAFDIMDTIYRVLTEDSDKRVVFLSSEDNEFVERLKKQLGDRSNTVRDSFDLNQLTSESLEKNLTSRISFQGVEVDKRVLVGGKHSCFQALSSHISSFVVKNVTDTIGQPLPELHDVFIPRTLHRRNYIKKSIFKSYSLHGKFAISGITEGELERLIPFDDMKLSPNKNDIGHRARRKSTRDSQFLVLNPDNAEEQFNQLCEVHQNIQWIHMEDDQLIWKRSHGSVEDILEYIDEDSFSVYNARTILDMSDRIVLLVAEPGMGKTTLLTHLARKTKEENPSDWVVFISLNDHSELLDETLCKGFKASEFLSSVIKTTTLDKALFQHNLANNNNIVVFLDGVDELSESCLENCKLLLTHMMESNVKKIWVASRHFRGHLLENSLSTISFLLQTFSIDDQKQFIKNVWRHVETTLSKPQQEALISQILTLVSASIGEKERQFTGIPLQTKMLADIFEDYYRNKNNNNLPEKLNLLTMYEMFVETKYRITFEKNNFLIHKHRKAFRNHCKQSNEEHMAAALVASLDSNTLQMLHDKNITTVCEKFMYDVMSGEEKTGIVDRVVNGVPHFVHKMFAEFYAGIWLAENYQKNDTLLKTHFCREDFRVVRNIFDRKLSRENQLHTAVLNGDASQVQHLLKCGTKVNSVDLAGRTALHLASTVGFHNSSENKVNLTVANTLLDHGAEIDRYDTGVLKWTPLRYADETKAFDIIDLLLKNEHANHDDIKLTTQIIEDHSQLKVIIKNGFLSLMEFLLSNGLEVNAKLDNKNRPSLLHKAAEYGDENLSKLLIKRGADVTSLDRKNSTPLHNSADNGHLSAAQILLQNISEDREAIARYVNACNTVKDTAMHCAAQRGHLEMVRLLRSAGGDLQTRGWKGSTLLHVAAFNGHLSVVQFLLESISEDRGAIARYVNARDTDNRTAVHYAARGGHVDVIRVLVNAGGDLEARGWMGSTALHVAVIVGHLTVAGFLLENVSNDRCSIAQYVNARSTDNNTALHWAAREGHVDMMRVLFSVGGDLEAQGRKSRTPLHQAALRGHLSVARFLLENVSNDREAITGYVNASDADGDTAMHYAAERGNVELLGLLFKAGGDLEARGCNGSTLLHVASFNGHLPAVRFLLENVSGDRGVVAGFVNVRDDDGDTAMHSAANKGQVGIMRMIYGAGGDLQARDCRGSTLLHKAAFSGHVTEVRFVLENLQGDKDEIAGFVNVANADGSTAMCYAAHGGYLDTMRLLLGAGGGLDALVKGSTLLHVATLNGHSSVCRFLLENVSRDWDSISRYANARRPDGNTAMHCAARGGHLDIVRLLVGAGGDLQARGWIDSTPLHWAASNGRVAVVRFILDNVTSEHVNARNRYGRTAMLWAARMGHVEVMRVLFDQGGDIMARDAHNSTPLNVAAECGHHKAVEFVLDTLRAEEFPLGAHLDVCDNEGDSAVLNAARNGHWEVVRTLADKGAQVGMANHRGRTSLHLAALGGHLSTVEVILQGFAGDATAFLDARDSEGETAQATALRRGHSGVAEMLASRRDLVSNTGRGPSWWRTAWLWMTTTRAFKRGRKHYKHDFRTPSLT